MGHVDRCAYTIFTRRSHQLSRLRSSAMQSRYARLCRRLTTMPASCRPRSPHRTAGYVVKVLGGADPGTLPVEQPTKLLFILNLKTARAMGIDFPPALLARADEVIE